MTAHELARLLLAGPDLMVTRRGYEGGVHEVKHAALPQPVHLGCHQGEPFYGPHAYCEHGKYGTCWIMDDDSSCRELTQAIHLS